MIRVSWFLIFDQDPGSGPGSGIPDPDLGSSFEDPEFGSGSRIREKTPDPPDPEDPDPDPPIPDHDPTDSVMGRSVFLSPRSHSKRIDERIYGGILQ